jgi:hypothetical protein
VFIDKRSPHEVAEQFGFAYRSLRQLVYQFRQYCRQSAAASPFFAN